MRIDRQNEQAQRVRACVTRRKDVLEARDLNLSICLR